MADNSVSYESLLTYARQREKAVVVRLLAAPPEYARLVGSLAVFFDHGKIESAWPDEIADAAAGALPVAGLPRVFDLAAGGGLFRLFAERLGGSVVKTHIFGGGHVSQPLAGLMASLGHEVTVVDDRAEFAGPDRFGPEVRTIAADYAEAIRCLTFDESTCAVIVTRGHRHDMECLNAVIGRGCAYLGMIGSRRKVAAVFAALVDHGVPEQVLEKVHAPIGLDIGAATPQEIAISIAAEILCVLNGRSGGKLSGIPPAQGGDGHE